MPEASQEAWGAGTTQRHAAPQATPSQVEPAIRPKPDPPQAYRTSYLPQLDGLRAVAIIMVYVHHAYAVPLLWSGVDLFFILSGYLITNILLRDSGRMRFGAMLRHFYLRRAQRILPAYAVALVLIACFTEQDWRHLWPFYAFFLQNLPYAFGWMNFSALIPLWSLAVEQHFYLVWPFLVYFAPRRVLLYCMIGLLLGLPLLRAVCTPLFAHPEPIYVLTPFRIDTMAAGALAALLLPRCSPRVVLRWAMLAIVVGLLLYGLLSLDPNFRRYTNAMLFNALAYSLNIAVLGGVFVGAVVASPKSWSMRLLASAPMRGLGKISYAFYLFHFFMLTRLAPYMPARGGALAVFVLTVALATASWFLIEKPILSLGGGQKTAAVRPRSA